MVFDTTAFFSVWYWLLTACFWSGMTHFTHGVPYDVLRRAARHGGEDAELCDRLSRRALMREAEGVHRSGPVGAALGGFLLAALAVWGLVGGSDLGLGLFLLAAPATLMIAVTLGEAVRAAPLLDRVTPEILLEAMFRRRQANRFGSLLAVAFAISVLAWRSWDRIALLAPY